MQKISHRDIKAKMKTLYNFLGRKGRIRESIGQLINGTGKLITKHAKKAKVFNAFYCFSLH